MRQLGDLLITRALSLKTFILNQVNYQMQRQFRRCTRQRDVLEAYNVDNCYNSKDNSYRQRTRGNRIRSIATSKITFDCSRLSSTKRCQECYQRERLFDPWTHTTHENPTRSHQMTIFESTRLQWTIMCTRIPIFRSLPLTVNVPLCRRGYLRTNSASWDNYTMTVHLLMRSYPMAKLTYDENDFIVIGYSMSIYDFGEYPPQSPRMLHRARCLPFTWHCRGQFRSSEYQSHQIQFSHQYLQCNERWWTAPAT